MTTLLSLALLVAVPADAPARADGSKVLARFLDERTVAVLHVDLTALDVDALAGRAASLAKRDLGALSPAVKDLAGLVKDLTAAGARDLYVVASLHDVPERDPFVVLPLANDADARKMLAALERREKGYFEKIDSALVGGGKEVRKRLREARPAARPDVARALAGAGKGLARLVIVPPPDTARVLEEVMPTVPEEFGGGSVKPLSRGLRWAALSVEGPPGLTPRLTIQAADNDSARALHGLLGRVVKGLARDKSLRELVPDAGRLAKLWKPEVRGDRLTLAPGEKAMAPVLGSYLARALDALARAHFARGLRRILTALHSYEAEHKTFPAAASYDSSGKPLLSWRVHLLPYLGHGDLYKEFRLDEPWDSEHNKKLLEMMPAVYRPANPKLAAQHRTTCLAPRGKETMFPGKRGLRIADVTDGTASTIFLVDADDEHAVPWTKPDDLPFDPKDPARGLSARHGGHFMLGFVDGSVYFVPKDYDRKELLGLFTRSGGEAVTPPGACPS
jgi:hypothetical protein